MYFEIVIGTFAGVENTFLMPNLGHIISVVSWDHWVFQVLQQTPSTRRPDRGWSDPGLCPSSKPPPCLSPLLPEPSRGPFCCLYVAAYGSSSAASCYAQCAVVATCATCRKMHEIHTKKQNKTDFHGICFFATVCTDSCTVPQGVILWTLAF